MIIYFIFSIMIKFVFSNSMLYLSFFKYYKSLINAYIVCQKAVIAISSLNYYCVNLQVYLKVFEL